MSKTLDDLIEREEASHAESEGAKAFVEKFRELLAGAKFKRPDLDAEITRLTARIAELEKALGWFLSDDRFRVAVGGSPHVVEKMIADARTILEASERGGE